jgi:hypothetical protein
MFAVVAVRATAVGSCRAQMAKLAKELPRKGGAIHFKKESDTSRSRIYRQIAQMPLQCRIIWVPSTVKPIAAREIAVRSVARLARSEKPQRIVFETDEAALKKDRVWLHEELPPSSGIEYQHLSGFADPMLWIADGIAWAVHRGGFWRAMINRLIIDEIRL